MKGDPKAKRPNARTLTLDQAREAYYEATGQTSALVRQLAFAGIAIIWILSGGALADNGSLNISDRLLWAGLGLVVALTVDLAQYAYRSVAWGAFARSLESRDITETTAPDWINWPPIAMLVVKTSAVAASYVALGFEVAHRLNQ
jgi:hypothetical protein